MRMDSPKAKQTREQAPEQYVLNVVLHGLFGYVIRPTHISTDPDIAIEILVPQMDEHVYLAGTWLQELRLGEGRTYQLRGATANGSMPELKTSENPVVQYYNFKDINRSPQSLYCSLELPFPKCIVSIRRAPVPKARQVFSGNDSGEINRELKGLATVQVFVYKYESIDKLKLTANLESDVKRFDWQPKLNESGTVNLHVFAEAPFDLKHMGDHAVEGMKALADLFPLLDLQLDDRDLETQITRDLPLGVSELEEHSLSERYGTGMAKTMTLTTKEPENIEIRTCFGGIFVQTQSAVQPHSPRDVPREAYAPKARRAGAGD